MDVGGGWIIELDIQSFFDHVDHRLLNQMLDERVRDGVIRRAIGKWLNAGVMEAGEVHHPDAGTPQGGVVSPILANIYLHVVLDRWFEQEVRPRLWGRAFMVRYADDAVLGFANEADARRVMAVLPKRFARFGLSLHPEKTRLLGFKPPRGGKPSREGEGAVRSFDFLGFTHFWKRARRGGWVISRKTAKDRYSRALRRIGEWCRKHRHEPVGWQHRRLSLKLLGHYAYYGITGNARALSRLLHAVERLWRKWLLRRSHRTKLPWSRFKAFLQRHPLALPRVVHSVYRRAASA